MKRISFIFVMLLAMVTSSFAADVSVSGKLNTWAATTSNTTDKDDDASDSVGFLYIIGEINTNVKLAENVEVRLEIELNDKVSDGASIKNGVKYTGSNSGPTPSTVDIDEAWVQISEVFTEALTLKIGHQRLEYSLRNNKRSMVLNGDFTTFKGKYKFEKGFVDAFYGKKVESLTSVNGSSDSDIVGVHLELNVTENGHIIAYLNDALFDNANAEHGNIISVGAGAQWFLLDKHLELFGEVAFQTGEVDSSTDHSGIGADFGARWTFGELGSIKGVYVELNVGYRSGEDDDSDQSAFWNKWSSSAGTFFAEGRYSSESPLYQGYADDKYLAIRLEAGASWTDKISSGLVIASYDNTDEDADPYGVEVDVTTKYKHTDNLNFNLHLAVFLPDDGLAADGDTVFAVALETSVMF